MASSLFYLNPYTHSVNRNFAPSQLFRAREFSSRAKVIKPIDNDAHPALCALGLRRMSLNQQSPLEII